MKQTLLLIALGSVLALRPTFAAEPTLASVVTAAKRPQAVDTALASVTVLTRADIERIQAQDTVSLLRHFAGVDLSRTGGPGSQTSVFLRGTNSNHVLVLINGVRVASANSGAYAFEGLPIELIERIELVRGPLAALYGSDAIGGVIQIFTRTPETASVEVGVARYDSFRLSASHGYRTERGGVGIALSRRGSQGFSSQNVNGFSFDPDRDGSYIERALITADTQANEQLNFRANLLRSATDTEFDDGRSTLVQRQFGVTAMYENSETHTQTFRLGYASEVLDTPVFFSTFRTRRLQGDWQHDFTLAGGKALTLGLNTASEKGSAGGEERKLIAPFARFAMPLGGHELEASVRADDDSQFGLHGSFSAAWGYQFESARVFANFGQGFRAPNLNELYSPGFGGLFAGNENLDPERSNSFEIGADQSFGEASKVRLRAFRTRISDLISFSGGQVFSAENIARAAVDGIELSAESSLFGCKVSGDITLQDPRNLSNDQTLLRRPKRKIGAHANCDFDALNVSVDGFGYSSREDFGATLPGYGLADLSASYQISPAWSVQAKLENLFDREYELARGFNTPQRTWLVTVKWLQ
jgi:vitamin B12 transporter